MARPKGVPNKQLNKLTKTLKLTAEARMAFVANLIVDAIEEDKKNGSALLSNITEGK